ncbi:MAG: hypothetical protein ABSH38_19375 [Verrucomicrobiota bacterium]|jgi:membrane protein implicated in regulation of membrane protease activity
MGPFWRNCFEDIGQTGRYSGALFLYALAGVFAFLIAVALLVEIPLAYSPVPIGAFLIIAAFCLWRAVRRARRQREGYSSQPLSREEWRKARSKLLGNQNMRKP